MSYRGVSGKSIRDLGNFERGASEEGEHSGI